MVQQSPRGLSRLVELEQAAAIQGELESTALPQGLWQLSEKNDVIVQHRLVLEGHERGVELRLPYKKKSPFSPH